jgi:hypothetical protein
MLKDKVWLFIGTTVVVYFSIWIFYLAIRYLQDTINYTYIASQVVSLPLPQELEDTCEKYNADIDVDERSQQSEKEILIAKYEEDKSVVVPTPEEETDKEIDKPVIGKIGIILDDAGYSTGGFIRKLWKLKAPLTISIIPGEMFSKRTARIAYEAGFEVMLHMPMEYCENSKITDEDILCEANRKNDSPYKWALLCGMSEEEIERQLEGAINDIPYVKGINNHMGSKATITPRLMSLCMKKLKNKGIYFVDSVTTGNSIAYNVAVKEGIQAAKRDVFLDNEDNIEHVKKQMRLLIETAKRKGYAIGIGHITKPSTIAVLCEMIPKLRKEGIEVVPVSELVK